MGRLSKLLKYFSENQLCGILCPWVYNNPEINKSIPRQLLLNRAFYADFKTDIHIDIGFLNTEYLDFELFEKISFFDSKYPFWSQNYRSKIINWRQNTQELVYILHSMFCFYRQTIGWESKLTLFWVFWW